MRKDDCQGKVESPVGGVSCVGNKGERIEVDVVLADNSVKLLDYSATLSFCLDEFFLYFFEMSLEAFDQRYYFFVTLSTEIVGLGVLYDDLQIGNGCFEKMTSPRGRIYQFTVEERVTAEDERSPMSLQAKRADLPVICWLRNSSRLSQTDSPKRYLIISLSSADVKLKGISR